jgi:serine protease Do
MPGVVNIRTKLAVKRDPALDLYNFFLDGKPPASGSTTSLGSGVIIDPKGYILTNWHVVKDATKIDVFFAKTKKTSEASIVGMDAKTDLVLLKVQPPHALSYLDLGDSEGLRVGDQVVAIGNPFGFSHTVTAGIISAKGRVIGSGPWDNYIQTDASINPGNSGGPLLDLRGRVIGISTAVHSEGHGIGFAIPTSIVKSVVRDLRAYGKVVRPWLGIVAENIESNRDVNHNLDGGGNHGIIITNLIVDGPGIAAGLRISDVLLQFNQVKISDVNMLQRRLGELKKGDQVEFKIYRRSKGYLTVKVNLQEIPKGQDLPAEENLF